MALHLKSIAGFVGLLFCYFLVAKGRRRAPQPTERVALPTKCAHQLSICFALDGSETISPKEFGYQQAVVTAITNHLSETDQVHRYAAVQYGLANHAVTPLTASASVLQDAVKSSRQCAESGSFVTAGLNYCFGELNRVKVGRRSIVLLGNGRNTIGSEPADRAALFRASGGQVLVIGVGESADMSRLVAIDGRHSSNVLSIVDHDSIQRIAELVVSAVCKPGDRA